MRYRRLLYFLAVADELSFTRAAERLRMAQPPLSQQIALLEKDIGVPLFDRSRRAIRLTAAGEVLHPEARRLLADVDETLRTVRRVGQGAVGTLAIGFVPSAINGNLPDLLRTFRASHPEVELILREIAPDALLHAVHSRRVDVGLLYRPISDPDLAQRQVATEQLLLALPDAHRAAEWAEVALRDVRDERFILPEQHDVPGLYAAVSAVFSDARIAPRVAQRGVWLVQTVLGLVAAGVGLAVVPSSAQALRRHGVTLRPLRDMRHQLEVAAVWLPDHPTPALSQLLALLDDVPD